MGPVATPAGRRHGTLELSARPAALAAANDTGALIPPAADLAGLRAGQAVQGCVPITNSRLHLSFTSGVSHHKRTAYRR